jgi:hypothetical protein
MRDGDGGGPVLAVAAAIRLLPWLPVAGVTTALRPPGGPPSSRRPPAWS